jgi:hypothetical protein
MGYDNDDMTWKFTEKRLAAASPDGVFSSLFNDTRVFCTVRPIRTMCYLQTVLIFMLLCVSSKALAGGGVDFWHSYTHQPDGLPHYSFRIAKYKRGLFFGSCGPSTRSLQWEYEVDLAGAGPVYEKNRIEITAEGKNIEVLSGRVAIDSNQEQVTIDLRVKTTASTTNFIANGAYRIHKLK